MPVYATREIAKVGADKVKRSKIFFELLTIHIAFTLFLLSIYVVSIFVISDFKHYHDLALLGGSLILFNVFSIEWLFSGVNDFKYITLRSLFIRAISIAAIFYFVKSKEDFAIYFYILVCTIFLTVLVDIYSARRFISKKINISIYGILTHVKPITILGVYMVLTSIYSILPTTLLGFLSTKSAVGYYFGANKITRMTITIFTALITVMIPRLNQILEEKRQEEYMTLINKSLNIVISFGIPMSFFVFLLAEPIVMVLAGNNFVNSIVLVKIMSPIVFIVALAQIFVLLILSVHRKDQNMVALSLIGMSSSLAINIFFIPRFAEKATAFSQLIAEFLVTLTAYLLSKKVLNFKFPLKLFVLNSLLALPFAMITKGSLLILSSSILAIAVSGLLCGIYFIYYQIFILKNSTVLQVKNYIYCRFRKYSVRF